MPPVLLPSCTRLDVLNFLEHFCSLLLQSNHSVICTAWPPMHCVFAAPSIQCTHAPAMVCTRHSEVGLHPDSSTAGRNPSIAFFHSFFSSASSWTFSLVSTLLPLYLLSKMHRSLSGRLPTCHRTDRSHRTNCLKRLWTRSLLSEVTQNIDEVTASETFASYATGNWDIP